MCIALTAKLLAAVTACHTCLTMKTSIQRHSTLLYPKHEDTTSRLEGTAKESFITRLYVLYPVPLMPAHLQVVDGHMCGGLRLLPVQVLQAQQQQTRSQQEHGSINQALVTAAWLTGPGFLYKANTGQLPCYFGPGAEHLLE
jgi:hypothetical protein